MTLSKVVEGLKKESSKWAKTAINPKFYWQTGYGRVSVERLEGAEGRGLHRQPGAPSHVG